MAIVEDAEPESVWFAKVVLMSVSERAWPSLLRSCLLAGRGLLSVLLATGGLLPGGRPMRDVSL